VITHPEKVLFPDDGITKGEVAEYYRLVAPLLIPQVVGRPVTMERFPRGIDAKGFLQKNVVRGFPAWLERVEVPKKGGTVHYPLIMDERSLEWVVNQNTITPHVWSSRVPHLDRPDLCIFDLDPSSENDDTLVESALALRDLLAELSLPCWVKTSGSKGFHIVIPLEGGAGARLAGRFAEAVAQELVRREPRHLTLAFSKADRGGRILVDVGRNNPGATFAAVYSIRARRGAPVSAPCSWKEVEQGKAHPRAFTLRDMPARLASAGDLWGDLASRGQSLRAALRQLAGA
jgi:bifunctional non-homologous end joining protein LigD